MEHSSGELALIGGAGNNISSCNLSSWIFSNPFSANSEVIREAPNVEAKNHHIAPVNGDSPLFINEKNGNSVSWKTVKRNSLQLAAGLQQLVAATSTRPQDSVNGIYLSPVVLIHLPNCIHYASILFGTLAAGLTATMASSSLTAEELAMIIKRSQPQVIITSKQSYCELQKALLLQDEPDLKNLDNAKRVFLLDPNGADIGPPNRASASDCEGRDIKHLLTQTPLDEPKRLTTSEAKRHSAIILWSSGTSGRPKGVIISHDAVIACLSAFWHINLSLTGSERWLGFVPFYHIFGLLNVLMMSVCTGAMVYVMEKFDQSVFLQSIPKYSITTLHMAPPVAVLLAKNSSLKRDDFKSVHNTCCGGAPVAWDVVESIYKQLGVVLRMGYGLSETGGVCNQVELQHNDISSNKGNTGVPLHGVEIKIVDAASKSKTMKKGEEGVIMIRSRGLMSSYLNDKQATHEAIDDKGWFDSGDLGMIDKNGCLKITGRLKDVIKVRAFQVSPVELEDILLEHPSIADAAVGSVYNDAKATELPRAYIVPKDQYLLSQLQDSVTGKKNLQIFGEEIRIWMEKRTIHYKWLKGNIVFISALPKSLAGKILRRLLPQTKGISVEIYPSSAQSYAKL